MSISRFDGGWAYVNPAYGKPPLPKCTCWNLKPTAPHAPDCPRYRAPSDGRVRFSTAYRNHDRL